MKCFHPLLLVMDAEDCDVFDKEAHFVCFEDDELPAKGAFSSDNDSGIDSHTPSGGILGQVIQVSSWSCNYLLTLESLTSPKNIRSFTKVVAK